MPIQIPSNLVPTNNNSFSLIEDVYIKGGIRLVSTFTDLSSLHPSTLKSGTLAWVGDTQLLYQLGQNSVWSHLDLAAAEASRATAAESLIASNLAAESARAKGVEAQTNSVVSSLSSGVQSLSTVAHSGNYSDLLGAPVNVSSFTNDVSYQTLANVQDQIQAVIGAAPAALATLAAIDAQLMADETAATALVNTVSAKALNADLLYEIGRATGVESTLVPKTTTVNGHSLGSNVTVTASDLGLGNVSNTSDLLKSIGGNAATATLAQNVVTNANLTGPVTSVGNATSITAGSITNTMLANAAVASLSGSNTGDETAATLKTKLGVTTLSGSNTGDQTISITGDVTALGSTGALSATVTKLNGAQLSTLATGLIKNTTSTGIPTIAVAGADYVVPGGALGTPSGGNAMNLTGTASGLTAGTVTTNANLTGDVTSVGNATTLTNAAVIGKILTGYSSLAGTVSGSDSILTAIGKLNGNTAALASAVSGSLVYQGVWDASANNPTIVSGSGTKGYYYKVSVAATRAIDTIAQWNVGDMIVFNGSTWDKIDGVSTEVTSVVGQVGAVTATQVASALSGQTMNISGSSTSCTGNAATVTNGVYTTTVNAAVLATPLTGYTSTTGTLSVSDTVLTAIEKLNGNVAAAVGGGVTGISVASSNGFAGSSSGGNTPAITLTTTISGVLKGNGTSLGQATQSDITGLLGAGAITNTMLANSAVANLSGSNTGDETAATIRTKLGVTTLSGSNTGDQTISITGDVTALGSTGSLSATVTKLNGVTLSTLGTGLLKNTTSTGVPTIAVAGTDYMAPGSALGTPSSGVLTNCTGYSYANLSGTTPTWNQNTTGNASTATALRTARTIGMSGAVSGSTTFDGSASVSIATTIPYDLAAQVPGTISSSQLLIQFVAVRNFTIPTNMANSSWTAQVATTSSAALVLQKNGSTICTVTFGAGATTASIGTMSQTAFAIGDVLSVVGPSVPDSTLASIFISIASTTS